VVPGSGAVPIRAGLMVAGVGVLRVTVVRGVLGAPTRGAPVTAGGRALVDECRVRVPVAVVAARLGSG